MSLHLQGHLLHLHQAMKTRLLLRCAMPCLSLTVNEGMVPGVGQLGQLEDGYSDILDSSLYKALFLLISSCAESHGLLNLFNCRFCPFLLAVNSYR